MTNNISEFDNEIMKKHIKKHENMIVILKRFENEAETLSLKELIEEHVYTLKSHIDIMRKLMNGEDCETEEILISLPSDETISENDQYLIADCIFKTRMGALNNYQSAFMMELNKNRSAHILMGTDNFKLNYHYRNLLLNTNVQ